MGWYTRKIVVSDDTVTTAVHLTVRQSLVPNCLGTWFPGGETFCRVLNLISLAIAVTILFFLWGFAYGLLDGEDPPPPTELEGLPDG